MDSMKNTFLTSYGKRLVLVADDEPVNREILSSVLKDRYDVLFAEDGRKALELIEEHRNVLSLVLLDILMPELSGKEVLSALRSDARYRYLPVIVLTSDEDSEVECLNLGASDFITKPYPKADIILARIQRIIELSEDRRIISSTERDQITGLYTRDYFYRYAEDFDVHHRDVEMDAIIVDISHFRMINERFGSRYGDQLLGRVGRRLREVIDEGRGIVCRREADVFLIYCEHGMDYAHILEYASQAGEGDEKECRIRLRMGVYARVDKKLDLPRRFDRAQIAAESLRSSVTNVIGMYDDAMHEKELFETQLVEEFDQAVREEQFAVYFQPKFDIRTSVPVLSSAEALVRWVHPELGLIPPFRFIPLFEETGLIQTLDHYIWTHTARKIREWKDRLGFCVPVSVNVSRIDMYDPHFVDTILEIVKENGLEPAELLLEITESAYTEDSGQIIEVVNQLRNLGFRIEMDDFGTGYSSLNMISELPIDALKLDMQFIRNAFGEHRDTWMLEVIIDIASYMHVPTIAEGVETEEQMLSLRELGCDIVQGYYFSKPVPAEEFEPFLIERKQQLESSADQERIPFDSKLKIVQATEKKKARNELKEQHRRLLDSYYDPQTGLYNETVFELLLENTDLAHVAVLAMEIDGLDEIRQKQGEEGVREAVNTVADALRKNFRSVDSVCRMGDHTFAVIMTRADSSLKQVVIHKVRYVNCLLKHPEEGKAPLTLSTGAAFGDGGKEAESLFPDACAALKRAREKGGSRCEIL